MLIDRDKYDIFCFCAEMNREAEKGDYTGINLAVRSVARTLRFLIAHPDMCAAELDDFLLDKEIAVQEFDRIQEQIKDAESQ